MPPRVVDRGQSVVGPVPDPQDQCRRVRIDRPAGSADTAHTAPPRMTTPQLGHSADGVRSAPPNSFGHASATRPSAPTLRISQTRHPTTAIEGFTVHETPSSAGAGGARSRLRVSLSDSHSIPRAHSLRAMTAELIAFSRALYGCYRFRPARRQCVHAGLSRARDGRRPARAVATVNGGRSPPAGGRSRTRTPGGDCRRRRSACRH